MRHCRGYLTRNDIRVDVCDFEMRLTFVQNKRLFVVLLEVCVRVYACVRARVCSLHAVIAINTHT
jgi:hypothetical protein